MSRPFPATFAMTSHGGLGGDQQAKRIEALLVAVTEKALAEGVTDQEEIRRRKISAMTGEN